MKHQYLIVSFLCSAMLLAGCGKQSIQTQVEAPASADAQTNTGTIDYWTPHFQISLPSSSTTVESRYFSEDDLRLTYGKNNFMVGITRTELQKGNEGIATMMETGYVEAKPYTLRQGVEGTVLISDLFEYPEENFRTCSISHMYIFRVGGSMYAVSFFASNDVNLDDDNWKNNCVTLSDAGHAEFVAFVNTVMETFQLNEEPSPS